MLRARGYAKISVMDKAAPPPFYLRRMQPGDIRQVNDIDREAFPENIPAPNYLREMNNGLAHYTVACDTARTFYLPEEAPESRSKRFWRATRDRLGTYFDAAYLPTAGHEYLPGFVGIWVLAGEAHLTTIAVRQTDRGKGVGEMLIIAAILRAYQLDCSFVTLELRVSNMVAQNLYLRYGFEEVGIRRGYYTDNREDARLMSTPKLISEDYRHQFQKLRAAYAREYAVPLPTIRG
jgi:[ribosomal protein S18]-alanine N-acetyltransferase